LTLSGKDKFYVLCPKVGKSERPKEKQGKISVILPIIDL